MRRLVIAAGLLLCFVGAGSAAAQSGNVGAQPPAATSARTENALYLEGGGPGLFYSLNYDRRFGDFAGRVGLGYLAFESQTGASSTTSSRSEWHELFTLPVTVSYLGLGSVDNMLELGVGAAVDYRSVRATTAVVPTALVGYRHQPIAAGLVFRIGVSLLLETSDALDFPTPVLPWPYLAIGGSFR